MDILSALLLFAAAVTGLFLMMYLSSDMKLPGILITSHVSLAALGFISLLIYALTTEEPQKHYHTLTLLSIAGVSGFLLWFSSGSLFRKKLLAILYSMLGMFGFLWLLTFIIP